MTAFVVELQQVLGLKGKKPAIAEIVIFGVQQGPERTHDGEVLQRIPDFDVLNVRAEFGQGAWVRAGGAGLLPQRRCGGVA